MSKEKQIEEIVNELIFCGNANKGVIAEHLYVKGYRKQDSLAFERSKDMIDIIKPYVSGLACEQESGSCELTDCRSCNARSLATELYDAGYRKQSEWISVDEMLPEPYKDVLYFNGHSIGVDFICSDGTWCDEEVHNKPITHWMPLPEPPKMKGGAE